MRTELRKILGCRRNFEATFVRYGTRRLAGKSITTLLFCDVTNRDADKLVTTHVWMDSNYEFGKLNLKGGERVRFRATVTPYWKGFIRGEKNFIRWPKIKQDFTLAHPTKLKVVTP